MSEVTATLQSSSSSSILSVVCLSLRFDLNFPRFLQKSKKSNGEQQQKEGGGGEGKKKESGGGKGNATVVFKVDLLHCDGCVSRVMKCIRSSEGVKSEPIFFFLVLINDCVRKNCGLILWRA